MTSKTVVIPAGVDEIVEDAIPDCGRVDKLYLKEGAAIDWLPGHANWDCVKLPQSQRDDFFGSKEPWMVVTNGFFSGTDVQQPEFTFKKCDDECVRWMELRPREFQYVCSLAFELPREECDEVGGRWLFTRSPKSGNLLLQLAAAFMEGTEVEQDFPMALRCCEQACWCAIGDRIPFLAGEAFPGVEIRVVDQSPDPDWRDLFERATRLKEEVLTHFQRLDLCMFERVCEGDNIRCYRIPDHAFEGRYDLRDVLLPDELCEKHVLIGRQAFARCPNLRSITVAGMSDGFALSRHANSFDGCDSLSDRIQYSADGKKVMFCLNAPEECIVCDHVQAKADFAFIHSRRLRNFRWGRNDDDPVVCVEQEEACIPLQNCWAEPRKIGMRAFEGCGELVGVCTKGLDISLGARAFADCRMLCEYMFGDDGHNGADDVQVAFLDISAQGVFAGCETMWRTRPLVHDRGYLVVHEGSAGAQFAHCRDMLDCPPIIATCIPPAMFESCNSLSEVKCVAALPDIIKAAVAGKRPAANLARDGFSISTMAFAHCQSLERFKFCRLRVSLMTGYDTVVDLIDDEPRQVLVEHEAFLDCSHLSRHESSFAGALEGSDPTAFSGCSEFDGFVEG
ncbi:MAG: leucine-rich repeat protein [Victivallales bacterium]|nr:leucine-rich repeat protein [Victivallales bacterium]